VFTTSVPGGPLPNHLGALPKSESDSDDESIYEYNAEDDLRDQQNDSSYAPFKDLYKTRFLWYYDVYLATIEEGIKQFKYGTKFHNAGFEYQGNQMSGKFDYGELRKRLNVVRDALDRELKDWAFDGQLAVTEGRGTAAELQRHFEDVRAHFKSNSTSHVELELNDKNPSTWNLTIFGQPMTNLDGAIIDIRIQFSPKFPEEQPRVNVLTPLFHHRISPTGGVLCYVPVKKTDVKSHIEAILAAIQEESPTYDPRTLVHPEAAALMWGGEEKRRLYTRKLRRSVQDSMDGM